MDIFSKIHVFLDFIQLFSNTAVIIKNSVILSVYPLLPVLCQRLVNENYQEQSVASMVNISHLVLKQYNHCIEIYKLYPLKNISITSLQSFGRFYPYIGNAEKICILNSLCLTSLLNAIFALICTVNAERTDTTIVKLCRFFVTLLLRYKCWSSDRGMFI